MRVLVAEDDESLGAVLARGLQEQGYVVDLVPDGEAAAVYIRLNQYAVAVIDWRMPGLSGLDLVAQLRRRGSHVPRVTRTLRLQGQVQALASSRRLRCGSSCVLLFEVTWPHQHPHSRVDAPEGVSALLDVCRVLT